MRKNGKYDIYLLHSSLDIDNLLVKMNASLLLTVLE